MAVTEFLKITNKSIGEGGTLVLTQSNVLDFVNFPWETLTSLRGKWESEMGEKWREQEEEEVEWKLGLVCKTRKYRVF